MNKAFFCTPTLAAFGRIKERGPQAQQTKGVGVKIVKEVIKSILARLPTPLRYRIYRAFVKIPAALPENLVFKIAETKEELEAAFVLLHNAYVNVNLMTPDPSGMRVTPYHALPSSTTLIGKINDEVVATVTVIRDNPMGLPSDAFVDLSKLRNGGYRIAEISALAIKKGYRGRLLLHLLKFMYQICVDYLGVNHLIATLTTDSKSHELYEAVLFFEAVAARIEANYAFSNFRPVRAEHLNLDKAYGWFEAHYSGRSQKRDLFRFFVKDVLSCNQFPLRKFNMINYPVMNIENFRYFFVERTAVLKNMSSQQLAALSNIFKDMPQGRLVDNVLRDQKIIPLAGRRRQANGRFEVSYKTLAKLDNGGCVPVTVLDISRQGMRIASKENLGDQQQLEVVLKIQSEKPHRVSVTAQKIWRDAHGVWGLQVVSTNAHWEEMILFFEAQKRADDYKNSDYKKPGRKKLNKKLDKKLGRAS